MDEKETIFFLTLIGIRHNLSLCKFAISLFLATFIHQSNVKKIYKKRGAVNQTKIIWAKATNNLMFFYSLLNNSI